MVSAISVTFATFADTESDINPIDADLLHCGQNRRDAASRPFFLKGCVVCHWAFAAKFGWGHAGLRLKAAGEIGSRGKPKFSRDLLHWHFGLTQLHTGLEQDPIIKQRER